MEKTMRFQISAILLMFGLAATAHAGSEDKYAPVQPPPAVAKAAAAAAKENNAPAAVTPVSAVPTVVSQTQTPAPPAENPPTLEEARLTMGKWIETQQIISK